MEYIEKNKVFEMIDEIMGDRNIDTIRKALISLKERIVEEQGIDIQNGWNLFELGGELMGATLKLRGDNPINITVPWFEGAKYLHIDTCAKLDTNCYGAMYYSTDILE